MHELKPVMDTLIGSCHVPVTLLGKGGIVIPLAGSKASVHMTTQFLAPQPPAPSSGVPASSTSTPAASAPASSASTSAASPGVPASSASTPAASAPVTASTSEASSGVPATSAASPLQATYFTPSAPSPADAAASSQSVNMFWCCSPRASDVAAASSAQVSEFFMVVPDVMFADVTEHIFEYMADKSRTSLHPNIQKGMQTTSNLSWTLFGFDHLNGCFPAQMDMNFSQLDAKTLKDLAEIEDMLKRVTAQSVELLRVVAAWNSLCKKAQNGKVVYSVIMVHAWLNNVEFGKFQDLWEEYLWIKNPTTFDWSWHLHDFILGARKVFRRLGVLSSAVDVTRLSGVEIPSGSLKDVNWNLINKTFVKDWKMQAGAQNNIFLSIGVFVGRMFVGVMETDSQEYRRWCLS